MKEISSLNHTSVKTNSGAEIIVLDTGATLDAESQAMLQALHSRSIGGLRSHLDILEKKGADNFMANFYVGYGHASIGDCGNTVVFIEGVSMLAAKAIQDWRLYSGQEASTRYIDFETQPFLNPLGSKEGEVIQESWRSFYSSAMPELVEDLKRRYPLREDEKESVYNKAISARAFDILRGFLPAGSTTNLAWSTNLRQAADSMRYLRKHPLEEVREISAALQEALSQAHPNSFGHKTYEGTENYNTEVMKSYYFHDANITDMSLTYDGVNRSVLSEYSELMSNRPEKTELPRQIAEAGTLSFTFPLDFGSFRDLQRHRAIIQRMPLLTDEIGFEPWYVNELPKDIQTKAKNLLDTQKKLTEALNISIEQKQYYLPMGYLISNRISGDIAALIYMIELRATRFVHQTLRVKAQEMAKIIFNLFQDAGLVIHLDKEADRFDIKRGEHDITIK